jgi:hypothetical protein
MTKHKWHDEIVAWAGGAEIEWFNNETQQWRPCNYMFEWNTACTYRIKPQPKQPKYLYVYGVGDEDFRISDRFINATNYNGKIEVQDD